MISKGNTHDNGARLARYITTGKKGEIAQLWELRGFASRDITEAFRSVHVMAGKGYCKQPFFHVQVRNPAGEKLTRDQWFVAIDRIERAMCMTDQPRAIAVHIDAKTGHEHIHVAWSRIDPDTLHTKALPFFKLRLKRVSRELETDLGLTPVSNARDSAIQYAPKRHEEQQAIRLGVAVNDVRQALREAFERSDCGRSFQSALADEGVVLARGDRRDFVAIDPAGGIHALGKRILGASAADIRHRLSDLSPDQLPSVEDARRSQCAGEPPRPLTMEPQPVCRKREEGLSQFGVDGAQAIDSPASLPEISSAFVPPEASLPKSVSAPQSEPVPPTGATGKKIQSQGLVASLKRQFGAAVKALFKRIPPEPGTRRRRTGETMGTFRMVARSLLMPVVRLPPISRTIGFLAETLPWLHLWNWNGIDEQDHATNAASGTDNHLSPHP